MKIPGFKIIVPECRCETCASYSAYGKCCNYVRAIERLTDQYLFDYALNGFPYCSICDFYINSDTVRRLEDIGSLSEYELKTVIIGTVPGPTETAYVKSRFAVRNATDRMKRYAEAILMSRVVSGHAFDVRDIPVAPNWQMVNDGSILQWQISDDFETVSRFLSKYDRTYREFYPIRKREDPIRDAMI